MRSRFVIPAALLVTVAYVKGRLDANLERQEDAEQVPVATPPVDPILRAQAEAEDAMVIAQAQAAATAIEVERPAVEVDPPARPDRPTGRDLSYLSEWLATPTLGPAPRRRRDPFDLARLAEWVTQPAPNAQRRPRPRPSFDPARLAEWMTDPAPRPARPATSDEFDPAALAEWATNPTWGPLRRAAARDVLDAAALVEWASDPTWSEIKRARTRDAFEAAALAEWVTHVAPAPPAPADEVAEFAPEPLIEPEPAVEPEAEVAPEPRIEVEPGPGAEIVPVVEPAPVAEIVVDEAGRFSLGGWAAQPGHMVLTGVTFRDRRDRPVDPGAIRLRTDALSNVGEGGLVVLSEPGFAPDREGFTLLLAAEAPGSFAAAGVYEVAAGDSGEALAA